MSDLPDNTNKFKQAGRVKTINSSILFPENAGLRFILNVANMAGKTGDAIYTIFDKKWPKIKQEVRGAWATQNGFYKLGSLLQLAVQSDVWVISMLAQDEKLQTDPVALGKCLKEVAKLAKSEKASIHVSSLLTNTIPELQDLLTREVVNQGVAVSYYKEPNV